MSLSLSLWLWISSSLLFRALVEPTFYVTRQTQRRRLTNTCDPTEHTDLTEQRPTRWCPKVSSPLTTPSTPNHIGPGMRPCPSGTHGADSLGPTLPIHELPLRLLWPAPIMSERDSPRAFTDLGALLGMPRDRRALGSAYPLHPHFQPGIPKPSSILNVSNSAPFGTMSSAAGMCSKMPVSAQQLPSAPLLIKVWTDPYIDFQESGSLLFFTVDFSNIFLQRQYRRHTRLRADPFE